MAGPADPRLAFGAEDDPAAAAGGAAWAVLEPARPSAAAPGGCLSALAALCGGGSNGQFRSTPPLPLLGSPAALEGWPPAKAAGRTHDQAWVWLQGAPGGGHVALYVSYRRGCWSHLQVGSRSASGGDVEWLAGRRGGGKHRLRVDTEFAELAACLHRRFAPFLGRFLAGIGADRDAEDYVYVEDPACYGFAASYVLRSDVEAALQGLERGWEDPGAGEGKRRRRRRVAAVREGFLVWDAGTLGRGGAVHALVVDPRRGEVRVLELLELTEAPRPPVASLAELFRRLDVLNAAPGEAGGEADAEAKDGRKQAAAAPGEIVAVDKVERAVVQLRSGDDRVWKARARKMVERVNGLVAAGGPEALAAHLKVAAWVEGGALLELVRLVARGRLDAVDCESAGGGLSPAALARACAAMAGLFAFQRQILAALAYEVIEGLGRRPDCSPTLLRVAAELLAIKGFALAANQLGLQDALTAYLAAHLRPDDRLLHEFAAGLGLGADAGALPPGEAAAAVILPSGPASPLRGGAEATAAATASSLPAGRRRRWTCTPSAALGLAPVEPAASTAYEAPPTPTAAVAGAQDRCKTQHSLTPRSARGSSAPDGPPRPTSGSAASSEAAKPKPVVPKLSIPQGALAPAFSAALTRSTRRSLSTRSQQSDRARLGPPGGSARSNIASSVRSLASPASSSRSQSNLGAEERPGGDPSPSADFPGLCRKVGEGLLLAEMRALLAHQRRSTAQPAPGKKKPKPLGKSHDAAADPDARSTKGGPPRPLHGRLVQLAQLARAEEADGNCMQRHAENVVFCVLQKHFLRPSPKAAVALDSRRFLAAMTRLSRGDAGAGVGDPASAAAGSQVLLRRLRAALQGLLRKGGGSVGVEVGLLKELRLTVQVLADLVAGNGGAVAGADVVEACGASLLRLKQFLGGCPLAAWTARHLGLMHEVLRLFRALLWGAQRKHAGLFLEILVFDDAGRIWGLEYMRHVLAPRRAGAGPWPPPRAPATTEAMQVVCFEYLAEVAGGLRAASATSLAGTAGTAGGHHRRAGSATALALGELDFLLNPRTGYVRSVLLSTPAGSSVTICAAALRFLAASIAALGPAGAPGPLQAYGRSFPAAFIDACFLNFVRLYRKRDADLRPGERECTRRCLDVLRAFAAHPAAHPAARAQFARLQMVPLLLGELSLEHEFRLHGGAAAANSHATPAAAKRPEAEAEETPLTLGKLQLELPSALSIPPKAGPPPASKPGLKPAFKLSLPPKLDLGQLAPAGPAAQPGLPGDRPLPDGERDRQRAEEGGTGEPRFTGDLEEDVEMLLRMEEAEEEAAGHGGGGGNGEVTFGGEAEEDFDHGAASDESDLVIIEEPDERERLRRPAVPELALGPRTSAPAGPGGSPHLAQIQRNQGALLDSLTKGQGEPGDLEPWTKGTAQIYLPRHAGTGVPKAALSQEGTRPREGRGRPPPGGPAPKPARAVPPKLDLGKLGLGGGGGGPGAANGAATSTAAEEPPVRFTGDLEEDVALLERLEAAGGGGAGAEPGGGSGGLATEEKREGTEAATPNTANGGGSTRVPALKLGLKLPLPGGSGNGGGGAPPEPEGGREGGREREKEEEGQQTLLRQGSSSSALTELGEKMGSQSAKGHLTIFQDDLRSSMVRKQQSKLDSASPAGGPAQNYAAEREARRLYREEALHAQLLETLLHLLFQADGTLDKQYHERFPLEHRIPNVPFTLAAHLNHPENQAVTKRLLNRFQGLDTPAARGIARYLRLLAGNTYCKALYTSTRKIARGAFADVFACSLPPAFDPGEVILKAVDLPETVFDATVVPDVFSEISVMEAFKDSAHACTLLDYGIHGNRVHMVLERYPTSLRAWRAAHGRLGAGQVRLYLNTFRKVVQACCELLHANDTVHYDLKADNVLLQPDAGVDAAGLAAPGAPEPPFSVVLADFGESQRFSAERMFSLRNRGTECVKSPEMLQVSLKKTHDRYDRRRQAGVGKPADVWAVGCLLYELLTGEYLLHDPDWIRFFLRVTTQGEQLISEDKKAALASFPAALGLLKAILVRDPERRPTMTDVLLQVDRFIAKHAAHLPHEPPAVVARLASDVAVYSAPPPLPPPPEDAFGGPRPAADAAPPPGVELALCGAVSVTFLGRGGADAPTARPKDADAAIVLQDAPGRGYEPTTLGSACPGTVRFMVSNLGRSGLEHLAHSVLRFIAVACGGAPLEASGRKFWICAATAKRDVVWTVCCAVLAVLAGQDLFTAFVTVKRRLMVEPPNVTQVRILQEFVLGFDAAFAKLDKSTVYSCYCGRWKAALASACERKEYRTCDCNFGEQKQCCCGSCSSLMEGLLKKYQHRVDCMQWVHVPRKHVQVSALASAVRVPRPSSIARFGGGWDLYAAACCQTLVYARKGDHMAVVANWEVGGREGVGGDYFI